ncbi:protein FAR-RED IMPAIRED RESPONSE 1-like [Alnus glutinosa]|uniref:protein FAR-RED IMPAIRED RESPONSE 1-like n=1 Tax=Alnus glutinosa TaxID=3517 RepID=UPI002D7698C7|nr:protein FAR-RED IMPAIRED RESPONSE 1-like [Alnus glutinosa]
MDLSQLDLISQHEDDCSLTHIELDDVVPIEMDPENDGNEIVANDQLNDGVDNCRSKAKLIDGDKVVEEPKSGMLFDSIEEVVDYYRNYGKQAGFGVTQKKKKKYENGDVHYISLTCARGGKASSSSSNNLCKASKTSKTGCQATLNATLVDTSWYVTNVNLGHNHDLSPGKARYIRCNKKLDPATKRKLDIDDRAGIRTNKIYNALAVEAGGYENLTFEERECRNYIANSRRLRLGTGGAAALRDYFNRMRKVNDDFYFDIDVDDECRLRNVFWADARRAALISSEDTESFVWLFEAWLKCMKGRAPRAIITDQDRAMKNAIKKVFPNARHRFCLWHILKKLPEKFGSHLQYYAIKSAIRNCVYNSHTCDEFDACWQSMLECYNLEENAWLRGLYSERTFWVPTYLNDVFWAGMTTTQRSESMNAFFDGYVQSSTSLKEFVDQYDNALRRKVEVENVADFDSFNTTISCVSHWPFEKQFQKIYTHAKFREVQKEISSIMYCGSSLLKSECGIRTYQVIEQVEINESYRKKIVYNVCYNGPVCEVNCSCRLFESRGILCKHALSVLTTFEDVDLLLEKYFLNRWRKDLKRPYKLIKSSYDPLSGNPTADRYAELSNNVLKLAAIAAPNVDHCMELQKYVDMLIKKFSGPSCEQSQPSQSLPSAKDLPSAPMIDNGAMDCMEVEVCSPLVARTKGARPSIRKVHVVEKVVGKKSSKGGNKKQSNTNPEQRRKRKKTCQRSLVDELDTSEDPLLFSTDVQHDQLIETQHSVLTQDRLSTTLIGLIIHDSMGALEKAISKLFNEVLLVDFFHMAYMCSLQF